MNLSEIQKLVEESNKYEGKQVIVASLSNALSILPTYEFKVYKFVNLYIRNNQVVSFLQEYNGGRLEIHKDKDLIFLDNNSEEEVTTKISMFLKDKLGSMIKETMEEVTSESYCLFADGNTVTVTRPYAINNNSAIMAYGGEYINYSLDLGKVCLAQTELNTMAKFLYEYSSELSKLV